MNETIEASPVPVRCKCDVLVCGSGPAGCAAALADAEYAAFAKRIDALGVLREA